jgi:hypothetical protein
MTIKVRTVSGGAGSGRSRCLELSFHRGTETLDGPVDGRVDVRSCPPDLQRPGVFEVNGDSAPEPVAPAMALECSEGDSNALDAFRVTRDDCEHPVFRVRARLRADNGIIADHHDARHMRQRGKACASCLCAQSDHMHRFEIRSVRNEMTDFRKKGVRPQVVDSTQRVVAAA